MKITLRQLKLLGACIKQVELFKETFGDEVEITEAVVKEHGAKFNVAWLANNVLTPIQLADYEAKHAPIRADYEAKHAPLLADYRTKHVMLSDDYDVKCALVFWEVINKT